MAPELAILSSPGSSWSRTAGGSGKGGSTRWDRLEASVQKMLDLGPGSQSRVLFTPERACERGREKSAEEGKWEQVNAASQPQHHCRQPAQLAISCYVCAPTDAKGC